MTDYFTIEVDYEMSDIDNLEDICYDDYIDAVDFTIYVNDLLGNDICTFCIYNVTNNYLEPLKKMVSNLGKQVNYVHFDDYSNSTNLIAHLNFIEFKVNNFRQHSSSLSSKFPINKEVEKMLNTMIEILENPNNESEDETEDETEDELEDETEDETEDELEDELEDETEDEREEQEK